MEPFDPFSDVRPFPPASLAAPAMRSESGEVPRGDSSVISHEDERPRSRPIPRLRGRYSPEEEAKLKRLWPTMQSTWKQDPQLFEEVRRFRDSGEGLPR